MESNINNIRSRILLYITKKGISKRGFYRATGLSNGYLDKVEEVGGDKLESILKAYPELNISWLITGEGMMVYDGKDNSNTDGKNKPKVHSNLTIKGSVGSQNNIGDNANMTNYFGNEPKMPQLQESEVKYKTQIDLLNEELRAKELEIAKLQGQVELLKTMLNK